jgi:hypothetical protein
LPAHQQVPVAPVSEVDEIVHRVDALFKLADPIEKQLREATTA